MPRSSLSDALKPRQPTPAPTAAEPEPHAQRAPSRRGRKAVTIYLDTAAHRQLRMLGLETDRVRPGSLRRGPQRSVPEARESPDRRLSTCEEWTA